MNDYLKNVQEFYKSYSNYVEKYLIRPAKDKNHGVMIEVAGDCYEMFQEVLQRNGSNEFLEKSCELFLKFQNLVMEYKTEEIKALHREFGEFLTEEQNKNLHQSLISRIFMIDIEQMKLQHEKMKKCQELVDLDNAAYYDQGYSQGWIDGKQNAVGNLNIQYTYHMHKGSAGTTSNGCYTQASYHSHTGSSAGGGCYTSPVYHTHTGNSSSSGGCYTIPVSGTIIIIPVQQHQYTSGNTQPYYCGECDKCGIVFAFMVSSGYQPTMEHNCPNTYHYELGCGKTTSTVERYNLGCGKTASTVTGYTLGCGKTTNTIESATIIY